MAKTVQPIAIELGIKGGEKLGALNRSFRDLSKQIKLSDADIIQATKDVAKFAQEAGDSEATIKGQIKAFEGLREQATMGGKAYAALKQEISELKSTVRGSSDAVERERSNLVKLGSASKNSAKDLQYVIAQLEKLKSKVREDSAAFLQLGKDIKNLNVNLKEVEISAGKARFAINTVLSAKPERITGQIDNLNAAIASGTLEAEDLNAALRKLELLRVGAGRGPVAFRADVFSSQLGVDYFARLRKEYDNLEKTQAAITQRISEVNTELQNVSGYERRRSLTLELIRLNKELQQSIVSVTTGEQFQAMAIRQRMGGARESYAASGFGAFSAEIRQRTEAGEFTPGMQRARERARNEIVNEEAVRATTDIFDTWEQAYDRIVDAARDHKIEMARIKKSEGDLLIEIQDRQAAEELSREKAQNDKLLESFDQRLKQRNRVLQRSIAIKGSLGLSGTELSPLYEGIVGIGTSRASAEQARMGRTPQQALTDIIDVFNSDLDRTGDGFLDSERKLREAAIEFSGGSRKVRQAFEGIALGKTPEGMFPRVGESSREYRERLEISSRSLFDSINIFSRKVKKTGNGFLDSEQKLREAAIDFAGGSLEVRRAFEKISLGKTPISMFPGSAESKESYLQRVRGGFSEFNLPDFVDFRKGTTRELQLVRQQLEEFRLDLDPLSANFEKLERQAVTSISKIDKQLARRSRSGGRRLSAGQLAQAAGATISGGIFGGPEGFLGGAIGTVLGGSGGAFAGAAIGAQVGGLRRELGGYAEYAAQIEKLKIALKGLTRDQSEFNYALAASQKVTQDFNIPQQESIRGITRLAAAIKGAGGPLTDAEVVFRNVTTAIKATGGSAQDVEGAVTAMVQVFSKGKVSAEELSGQLGERLPGAVTMFAKANNMSLTELQDNLKAGTVGLNELMKFVRSLGDTYGATARKISDSNADAGARLQVVVNNMKTAIGDALIPIGAQLQDAFGKFLQEITPTLVEVLPKIGELLLGIVKNLDLVAQAAAAVFAVVVVGKITAIIASIGSLGAAIFTLKLNAIVATKALIGLNAAALLNPYVALAAGAAALGVAIFRAAQEQKRLNTLIKEGSVADIDKKLAENRTKIIEIEQRQLEGADPRSAYQAERRAGLAVLPSQASLDQAALKQAQSLEKKLKDARKRAVYDATQGADLPENLLRPFDYQSPKGDGGDGKGGSSAKEKRERKSQLESINARLTLLDIDKMIRANAREIVEAQADNNFERVKELSLQKLSLASQKEFASVQLDYRDALARAAGDENEQMLKAEAAASRDRAIQELRFKLKEDMLDLEQQSRLEQEARTRAAEDEVFALREQLGLVSPQERISRYRTGLEEQGTPNADELTDLYRQTIDPTFAEGISQNIRALKQDLEDLVNPINQITGAANAIGTAFTDSFMSVITNSATAQEALASFFSNVGKYFLDMAAQIIQKMIVLALLNQVAKLLPSGGSGPSGFNLTGFGNLQSDAGSGISGFMAGAGGILGRASGGLVMPGNTYMVGERGPELLQLNRNGSGQVINNNQLSSAMNRYRRPGGAAMTSAEGGMAASALSGSGVATLSKPIDVRYTVERINNVEYVTADQFQAGMRQAAQQGAMQGERRALTTLRQNTTQRKRIGL